nr:BRCA1-A complex subunit Abraxas-like [Biomphalaria glabrata]
MSLYIDGSTLSALCFKHLYSNGSQFGFLFGMRVNQTENRISDSQGHLSNTNTLTYVSSYIPWSGADSLYHRNGLVSMKTMNTLLQQTNQILLGWYSYRHNSKFKPSLKEYNLHTNLLKAVSCVVCPNDFLFLLCTTSCSENNSTHILNHGFMQLLDRQMTEVPMTVVNLGDTTRKEYHQIGNATVTASLRIKHILDNHRENHLSSPSGQMKEVQKVLLLAATLNNGMKRMASEVVESETLLKQLTDDVCVLKQLITQSELQELFALSSASQNETQDILLERKEKDLEENQQLELFINTFSASKHNASILSASDLLVAIDEKKKETQTLWQMNKN